MIPFTKMQGIGNDFILLDHLDGDPRPWDFAVLARTMNERRLGIGGDGLILVERGNRAPYRMRMFNPDGSESEMCGNGIRCFAKFVRDRAGSVEVPMLVETGAGVLELGFADQQVWVEMGSAHLKRTDVGMSLGSDETFIEQPVQGFLGTAVSMGNPHLVIFVPDVSAIELERLGPQIEHDPMFHHRINVHFVQVVSSSHLIQRTWERGAGATLACGTGACAVGVAGVLTARTERKVEIDLPGGRLSIEYRETGMVRMTGPAETVYTGEFPDFATDSPLELDLAGIREVELLEHL